MRVKIWIGFFIYCLAPICAFAQYSSRDGNFEVDEIRGCAPLTINIKVPVAVCDPANDIPCDFFFEGQPRQNVFKWTYSTPGVYDLVGVFQGGIPSDRITITVLPNTPAEFEVYSCGSNGVQVKITDTNYADYIVDFNDPSVLYDTVKVNPSGTVNHSYPASADQFITVRGRYSDADDNCSKVTQQVRTIPVLAPPTINQLEVLNSSDIQLDFNNNGQANVLFRLEIAVNNSTNFQFHSNVFGTSSVTLNNLRPDDNYYCFRLAAFDPCNNINYYSNTICSSNFDATPQNNINRLTWSTASAGVSNYAISKSPGSALTATSPPTTSLNDTDIICGTEYCYQQTTNYTNGTRSISLQKCATAISTDIPTVVENISSVVGTNSTVELRWTQDPAFNAPAYTVTKLVNGSFAERDTATTTTYTDEAYAMDVTSCYIINYEDACENKSPISVEVCPIMLVGTLQEDNAVSLSWNAYSGWENGVDHYIVEKFNDQGQLLRTFNADTNITFVDNVQDLQNQIAVYRITAIANDAGITSSISNTITIIKDPKLFYPTAFTPNRDGLNEVFNVFGQYIEVFEMRIFNRWGEMIYNTENIEQGWNGFYKGNPVPEGTYVFRATITDQAGRSFDRSGTILLLRKN